MRVLFLAPFLLLLALAPVRAQQTFVIPLEEDTLLYVDNRGVTRIFAELNGFPFTLVTDPAEVDRSQGAYLIPRQGVLTIDMAAYMRPGFDANTITFAAQGPAGADWIFLIAPVFVEGQTAAVHLLGDLMPYPERLALHIPSPNPTPGPVTIPFSVPAERTAGVRLRLAVVDALGREIVVLAEGTYFPGRFAPVWNGHAAAGVYFALLVADGVRQTRPITRLR